MSKRVVRKRLFRCATCGREWDYPMGLHTEGPEAYGSSWCKTNAKEVKTKPRTRARGKRT